MFRLELERMARDSNCSDVHVLAGKHVSFRTIGAVFKQLKRFGCKGPIAHITGEEWYVQGKSQIKA